MTAGKDHPEGLRDLASKKTGVFSVAATPVSSSTAAGGVVPQAVYQAVLAVWVSHAVWFSGIPVNAIF